MLFEEDHVKITNGCIEQSSYVAMLHQWEPAFVMLDSVILEKPNFSV
jgi:hypothetical protein